MLLGLGAKQIADLFEQDLLPRRSWWLCRLGFFLALEPVDLLDDDEDRKSDNDEIDDRIDKQAVVDCRRSGFLRGFERFVRCAREVDEIATEIDIALKDTDGRHDDVTDQRLDNRTIQTSLRLERRSRLTD